MFCDVLVCMVCIVGRVDVCVVGDVVFELLLFVCFLDGVVCLCSNVIVVDLECVWDVGFCEFELMKCVMFVGIGIC